MSAMMKMRQTKIIKLAVFVVVVKLDFDDDDDDPVENTPLFPSTVVPVYNDSDASCWMMWNGELNFLVFTNRGQCRWIR